MKSNMDAQDLDGETALHYAIMAGQTSTASLLISAGADTECENFFMEPPLLVAKQNPAYFLGVNTKGVVEALGSAATRRTLINRLSEAFNGVCTLEDIRKLYAQLAGQEEAEQMFRVACVQLSKNGHDSIYVTDFMHWLYQ